MEFSKFLHTDSYKLAHFEQYPAAKKMVAYGEFRKPYPNIKDERIVVYGIQYLVDKFLNKQWTVEELNAASQFASKHNAGLKEYPFPRKLFTDMIAENNGYFPVKVEAVPDGTVVYPHVPVYQITAEGKYSGLVTYIESFLSHLWYSTTVATLSRHTKTLIKNAFDLTVDDNMRWLLGSRLHDFGYRGCASDEQAMIGGAAHLLNFDGTDTMLAAAYAHYQNNGEEFAQSIPATEHSVMTSWPSEVDAVRNMIHHYGDGVFACVADSYDYKHFLHHVLPAVAADVQAKGGTMVIRPDSGDPLKSVIDGLYACQRYFGISYNKKGFKVLNNSAIIQGDGINIEIVDNILTEVINNGFSAQNVAFGMGAGLLHKHNRDTMSFATKLSYIEYADGTSRNIMKAPKTDPEKYSLPGILKVINDDLLKVGTEEDRGNNLLITVYDGRPVDFKEKFSNIRAKVEHQWNLLPPKVENLFTDKLKMKINETIFNLRNSTSKS
jgi:nicotinic acid phosphoribosyltransferase